MIGSHRTSLTHSVSKMLVELLVLSRMRYAISTWGPALQHKHISRLQRMQYRGVRLSCKKYDHVSSHRLSLRWLSVQDQIKQSTLSCMYRQCHYQTCLKLDPPIQFGSRHYYFTRTNKHFANITRFSTAFGQKVSVIKVPLGGMLYHLTFVKFLRILHLCEVSKTICY